MRLPVKAGLRTVGVTFPREGAKIEPPLPGIRRIGPPGMAATAPPRRFLSTCGSTAPGSSDSKSPTRLQSRSSQSAGLSRPRAAARLRAGQGFICRPTREKEESACAKQILATLARRAFRRPATDADLSPLLAFYERGRRERDFDYGVQSAIEAMLVSPDFLFRVERDPAAAPGRSIA